MPMARDRNEPLSPRNLSRERREETQANNMFFLLPRLSERCLISLLGRFSY